MSFAGQLAWVLRQVGTDRVSFGSDYPLDDPLSAIRAAHQVRPGLRLRPGARR